MAIGTAAGLVAEGVLGYHRPVLETIMMVSDVGFPILLALALVAAIFFGSDDQKDSAFRLLRWLRDKPEPPGPPGRSGKSASS